MLQRVLIFLAGVLVGANLVYLLMSRGGIGTPPGAGAPATAGNNGTQGAQRESDAEAAADLGAGVAAPLDRTDRTMAPGVGSPERPLEDPAQVAPGEVRRGEAATAAAVPRAAPLNGPAGPVAGLTIPVAGVPKSALADTFTDARGADRVHDAIDIMAPRGTPVVAAADGRIEKLFDSERGGLTIYQFEPSGRYAYYYAHLDRYAPTLAEGDSVRRGEVIGYVGSTGNASPDAPHLHFAVFALGPERNWWQGTALNPYPLLAGPVR